MNLTENRKNKLIENSPYCDSWTDNLEFLVAQEQALRVLANTMFPKFGPPPHISCVHKHINYD